MREIKFRAIVATDYDENDKPINHKMIEWSDDFFSDSSIVTEYSDCFPVSDSEYCQLMQYIGLKDNTKWEELTPLEQQNWINKGYSPEEWNGREIYEGDILKIPCNDCGDHKQNEHNAVVVYDAPEFVTSPYTIDGFFLGEVKVIGNIHEHPELLEELNARDKV